MKKLLLLLSALAACLSAQAVYFSSIPGSANSGESYWVGAEENNYSYDTEVYLYKNGSFFAYGNGWGYASAGGSSTDYGDQYVTYEAYSSWYDEWWNSYSDYTSAAVHITVPNNPPTIAWVQNPDKVATNQWFTIQARGNDGDGNLMQVFVWRDGIPHAFNGGGNGYENYSDANGHSQGWVGTVTFTAQATDHNGATSEVIYHTVNVNTGPTIGWHTNPAGAWINDYFTVRAQGHDDDGNLAWTYVWKDEQPFAFNGGGNGYDCVTDANVSALNYEGTTTFKALAGDTFGDESGFIWHTVSVVNRPPGPLTLAASGSTVSWNSTYGHYTMQAYNSITATSNLQDPDGNLVDHTLRFQKVIGSGPNDNWNILGDHSPSGGYNSTKQATLPNGSYPQQITPGRWDFNTYGHDGYPIDLGRSITVWVYGTTNGAAFVSQVVNGVTNPSAPVSATTGDTFQVTITMSNTGDRPWENDASPHKLSARYSHWNVSAVGLPGGNPVFPPPQTPSSAAFVFNVTAPATPNSYQFQWQMVEDFPGSPIFFGSASPLVTINVVDNDPPTQPAITGFTVTQPTAFNLSWNPATDNGTLVGYDVFKNDVKLNSSLVVGTTYPVTGVVFGNTYSMKVRAVDAAGNYRDSAVYPAQFVYQPTADYDSDGMPNDWELQYGLDPYSGGDGALDADGDEVLNAAEYAAGTNPRVNESTALPAGWPNVATANTNLVGFTAGSFSVDQSGGSGYSIPLWVSPGTAGMQPSIALTYNSNGGNGYLGVGWNLSGIPVISRRNAITAADGFISAVNLDTNDRFALDGNRLIAVSGPHGNNGTEYRTERESFSRIYSYGSTGYGPEKFIVKTKAGLTMEFGSSAETNGGRIMAVAPASTDAVLAWSLDKITDVAGNYCQFYYAKDASTGEFYIQSITYTGNAQAELTPYAEVEFVYETRGDVLSGFTGGAPWARSKRLKKVISKYNSAAIRSYVLTYETSPNTNRSRLLGVREFDADNNGLQPITFEYKAETNGWGEDVAAYQLPESLSRILSSWMSGQSGSGFVDIDNDGLPDYLHRHDGQTVPGYPNRPDVDLVARNTGSSWDQDFPNAAAFRAPGQLGYDYSPDLGVRFIDLDSDGYMDIIAARANNYASEPNNYVYLNTSTGWQSSNGWLNTSFYIYGNGEGHLGTVFADLDGDGRTDVMWARYGTNEHGALRNTGTGWANFPAGYNFSPPVGIRFGDDNEPQGPAKAVDINGDGLIDIVQYKANEPSVAYLNTGTGWVSSPSFAPKECTVGGHGELMSTDFVDVNGDGLVDQVTSRFNYSPVVYYAKTWLNTGKGWMQSADYALPKAMGGLNTNGGVGFRYGAAFADFNGDGLVDYMYATRCDTDSTIQGIQTYLNTGFGWTESTAYVAPVYLGIVFDFQTQDTGTQLLDVNGDGMVDVLSHIHYVDAVGSPRFSHAYLNSSGRPDLLQKITASSGLQTSLSYKYLTDKISGVYTRGERPASSTFPVIDVQNPTYVVQAVTQDDGNGGTYLQTYSYGELRQSLTEGNLGFGWMKVHDSRTNVTTESIYRQDYPFVGLPASVISRKSNGDKLSEVSTQWDANYYTSGSRVAYPFAHITVEKSYEPNSTSPDPFLTKTTTVACNSSWGDFTEITTEYSDGYKTIETRNPVYVSSATALYPGQMTEQTISVAASSLAPNPAETKTRTSSFTYDDAGRLHIEIIEPLDEGDPRQHFKGTTYTRDVYGNVSRVQVYADGDGVAILRITDFEYSASLNGRFLTKRIVNVGENHITSYDLYDEGLGALKEKTEWAYDGVGPEITTTYAIDSLGRVTSETRPDGTTTISRFWSASGPTQSIYAVQTLTGGGAPMLEFFDALGRSRRTVTVTGDRQITKTDTTYNNRGLVDYQSRPYTGSTAFATTTQYDVLGRASSVSTPTGIYTHVYDGFKTTTHLPVSEYTPATGVPLYTRGGSKETTRTGQGWTTKVIDTGVANGVIVTSQITYTHDPFGSLKTTTDSNNNVTTITPDLYGRMVQLVDPDRGTWNYVYYGTGELREQTDARGKVTRFEYDGIGRVTKRTVDATAQLPLTPQVTTWVYDTASGFGRGSLQSVAAPAGYSESRTYDALGHPAQISRTIDGTAYALNYTYDSVGRLKTTTYPSALTVRRYYEGFGHLAELRNNATQALYFRGDEYTAEGQLEHAVYGNGVETDRSYRPEDGLIEMIQTGRPTAPTELQYLAYSYEPNTAGNLYKRTDFRQNLAERFTYDGLARLTEVWRKPAVDPEVQTLAMTYNAIGNLMSRGGQNYSYWSTRPHAVQTALGNTYGYDANGNLTGVTGAKTASLSWTAFNQPDTLTQGSVTSSFKYDADLQRVLQTKDGGRKIVYVGRELEREVNGGTTTDSHYLFTPLGRTVEIVYVNGAPSANRYYFTDHLGSVDTVVTDAAVTTPERLSYDAWGVRRLSDWTAGGVSTVIRRGYTDHEMLDGFGLVHMNGRIYDSALGRFLSADPLNQDIFNTQTYNAYSYVLNNPLSYTDPTGMAAHRVGPNLQKLWRELVLIVTPGAGLRNQSYNVHAINRSLANSYFSNNSFKDSVSASSGGNSLLDVGSFNFNGDLFGNEEPRYFEEVDNSGAVATAKGRYQGAFDAGRPLLGLKHYISYFFTPTIVSEAGDDFDQFVSVGSMGMGGGRVGSGSLRGLSGRNLLAANKLSGLKSLGYTEKLADHHLMPRQFEKFFKSRGIRIDDFTVTVDHNVTHLKAIHGTGNMGQMPGRWNQVWSDWIKANPNATFKEIFQQTGQMMDDFAIGHLKIHPYGK